LQKPAAFPLSLSRTVQVASRFLQEKNFTPAPRRYRINAKRDRIK
jgi:hypothetical protein